MTRAERYRARRERRLRLHDARGPILPWDVALTIAIVVVAMIVLPVVTTVSGSIAAAAALACSDESCAATAGVAFWLGLGLPLVTLLVGATVSIVRLVRHRRGWKTAVVTIAGVVLCLPLSWGVSAIATLV